MQKAILYNDVVYPESMQNTLHLVDFLNSLSEREKDILRVFENISAARFALYPDILTRHRDYKSLETIQELAEKYNWPSLLSKPIYEEGFTTDGNNFYQYNVSQY